MRIVRPASIRRVSSFTLSLLGVGVCLLIGGALWEFNTPTSVDQVAVIDTLAVTDSSTDSSVHSSVHSSAQGGNSSSESEPGAESADVESAPEEEVAAVVAADAPVSVPNVSVALASDEGAGEQAATQAVVFNRQTSGKLGNGDTLASSLASNNITPKVADRIAREMRGYFDFRLSHPGDSYQLVLDDDGAIESFRYRITDLVHYDLVRDEDGRFEVNRTETKLAPRQTMLAGIVATSLYGSIKALGASAQLADDFADVFSYDVDFSTMAQVGDEYRILYERLYRVDDSGEEVFVRPGRILAARYSGENGEHTAVYYESEEGEGGYYRPDGSSVEREFLMAPLHYSRISSRYSSARRHPILKITRPHHGIDYAAPQGTPVFAVAGGEVIHKSRAGGFGNLIKVRHENGYTSYYAHLSRYASGLRLGQRVSQKQVIGYVGKTGLATGPHVCFRVAKDGKYVNPARIASPPSPPLPAEAQDTFRLRSDKLLAALDSGTLVAADEAL